MNPAALSTVPSSIVIVHGFAGLYGFTLIGDDTATRAASSIFSRASFGGIFRAEYRVSDFFT